MLGKKNWQTENASLGNARTESMRLRLPVVCYSARYHELLILSSHHISTGTEHMKVRACHQIGGVINLIIAI